MLIFMVNIRLARTVWNSTHCLLSLFTIDWWRNLFHTRCGLCLLTIFHIPYIHFQRDLRKVTPHKFLFSIYWVRCQCLKLTPTHSPLKINTFFCHFATGASSINDWNWSFYYNFQLKNDRAVIFDGVNYSVKPVVNHVILCVLFEW